MTTIVVDPATAASQTSQDDVSTETQSSVPEKYRGKSLEDIIAMHQNAESELGRKNNEVGSLRKLTDQVLGLAQNARFAPENRQTETARPTLTSEDLLADPTKTVTELARHEADQRAQVTEKRTANLEARLALDQFSRKYPDFEQTLQTEEFKGWLGKSSYRQKLAYSAAQNDFDAADELLGSYIESKGQAKTEETTTTDTTAEARKASLVKRGGSSAAGVSTSGDGKGKIYSRTELIDMRINKPDEYEARYHTEFLPAYREKRVR